MRNLKTLPFLLVATIALFIACDKEGETTPIPEKSKPIKEQAEKSLTEGLLASEFVSMEMEKTIKLSIDLVAEYRANPNGEIFEYPQVKEVAGVLFIDWGYLHLDNDGTTRSGKYTFNLTDSTPKIGTRYTFLTEDTLPASYSVNGYVIKGKVVKTISGIDTCGFTESVQIICPNKTTSFVRSSAITRTYDSINQQIFSTGMLTVNDMLGLSIKYTIKPTDRLVYAIQNKEIVSGICEVKIKEYDVTWTINFGNGISDGKAMVSDGTNSWEIDSFF